MNSQKSVMSHSFARVPSANIPRSSFDRSHGYKTTFNSSDIIPIYIDEGLPGDTFSVSMSAFARMMTPIFPIMDNLFMDFFFFAVPNRIVMDNWIKLMGEQKNPNDSIDFLVPQIASPVAGYGVNSLQDYFGLPTGVTTSYNHSALPLRAYNLIYNEWFRDQNLQDSIEVPMGDGPDQDSLYKLLRRNKRHDYFTSSLPWPNKGGINVDLPIAGLAPVQGFGIDTGQASDATPFTMTDTARGASQSIAAGWQSNVHNFRMEAQLAPNQNIPGIYADLGQVSAVTINQMRQSFQIQKLLERDARGGTRYTELIRSHFGVISPDARLQRPEYLGGGSVPIQTTPVPQTSQTDENSPQGNMAGYTTVHANGIGFQKSFTEHCTIIGMVSVRADLTYQQGLDRMWSRRTKYDFYWPSFAHLGEQAVLNKEIYLDGSADDELAFGYNERYAEYRYKPSKITGLFRSNAPQTLDSWHLSQKFDVRPTLSTTFIEENVPIQRVVAVKDQPEFLFDSYFRVRCARPMPVYSVPGLIDHF